MYTIYSTVLWINTLDVHPNYIKKIFFMQYVQIATMLLCVWQNEQTKIIVFIV